MRKYTYTILVILLPIFLPVTYAQTGSGVPTGTDTACAGGTALFKRVFGGGKDDFSECVVSTPDSGLVIAGRTNSFGNGGYDGLLMKVNKNGNVVWTRAVGGSGEDQIYNAKRTSDNGFIATGFTRSFGNAAGDAWLIKFDAAGNVQWAKKYGDGNVDGEVAFEVIQLSDGGYAFCGAHKFGPGVAESFVVRTDNQGVPIWSRQYGVSGSDNAWGITEDGSSLLVVGFYQGSSFYDGYVMKLDKSNGNVTWIRGYDAENRSTSPDRIRITTTGYQLYTLVVNDFNGGNQQHVVWNLNTDGTIQNVRKVVTPGSNTIGVGYDSRPDGGFITVNGESTTSSDILFTKINANGTLAWSKKFLIPGQQVIRGIFTLPDGGFAATGGNNNPGTVPDSNNVFLMRLDSLANMGFCSGINTQDVAIVTPSYTTPTTGMSALGNVTIYSNPVITVGVVNPIPVTTNLCFYCQYTVPVPIPPDTVCTNGIPFYMKTYGSNKEDWGESIALAADSGYVIAGQTNSFGNGGEDGYVMKVNKKGNIVWSKAIGGAQDDYFYNIKKTSDNGFIIVGQTKSYGNTAGEAWLVKLDAAGTVQWSKKYGDGNANGEIAFEVIQLSDGGYAFCGIHPYVPNLSNSFVVRTDNQGVVIWSKQYGNAASDGAWGITEDGTSLLVSGYYVGGSFYDAYIMKLDKSNGNLTWVKGYDAEGRSLQADRLRVTNSGYQVFMLGSDDFNGSNLKHYIWNLNTDGTVQNVRKVTIPGGNSASHAYESRADGSYTAVESIGGGSTLYVYETQPNGTLAWSMKYTGSGQQAIRAMTKAGGPGYTAVGFKNNGAVSDSNNVLIMRLDSLGYAGNCGGTSTTEVSITSPSFSTPASDVVAVGNVTINSPVITVGSVNVTPATTILCFYCQPRPTGSQRNSGNEIAPHILKVFPNPVIGGTINLSVDADYDDQAIVSMVDLYGNVVFTSGQKQIWKGHNLIPLTLPSRVQAYTNYFIHVKFKNYENSIKVFVINQ